MLSFFLTFVAVVLVFLALALGVLFGRKPVGGSCGGQGDSVCSCQAPCAKRKERTKTENEAG